MVKLNHELVDAGTQESAHVGQQPRHPEEVVTGLQQSQHILITVYQPAPKNIKYTYCEGVGPAGQSCEEARGEVTGGVDGAPGDQAKPAPGTKYTPPTSTKYKQQHK
jgi:hypothetical protein